MSDNRQSPYVVQQLRPENPFGGLSEGTYQLTAASVHPLVIVGVDEAGMPVEETRPPQYSRRFVGLDGCVNWVPLRTGVVFSMEAGAERYEQQTVREIVGAGQLPFEVCPYSYSDIRRSTYVKVPAGEEACDGVGRDAKEPCSHMRKVIELRKARAHEQWKKQEEKLSKMTAEDAKEMAVKIGQEIGGAIAGELSSKRKTLGGKGEP